MIWVLYILLTYLVSILILSFYEYYVYDGRYSWWKCLWNMPIGFYLPVINTVVVFIVIYDVIYSRIKYKRW